MTGLAAELAAAEKDAMLDRACELLGLDRDGVGSASEVTLWQGMIKNKNDEAEIVDLARILTHLEPQWPVVQQAKPTIVKPVKSRAKKSDVMTTIFFPDPQFGFRRLSTGEMIPMHDETAIDVALQIAYDAQPDRCVNLGDGVDLPEWSSKFLVKPEFVLTTQPALDSYHLFLAKQRAILPPIEESALPISDEDLIVFEGNHDDRLAKQITKNAMAALRLKRANAPESWPVLSIPFLLRLDDLGATYVPGYPAGRHTVAHGTSTLSPLVAAHGQILDLAKVAASNRQSQVQGHSHHIGATCKTYQVDHVPVDVWAISPGCLCRRDGVVPSTNGGEDFEGVPIERWEDWQQGVLVVEEEPDGHWTFDLIPIQHGRARWRGKSYESAV